MGLSTTTLDVLDIIERYNPKTPAQVGRLLWPDNPGWFARTKNSRGVGMALTSGALMAKLERKGLVRKQRRYCSFKKRWLLDGYEITAKAQRLRPKE